MINMFMEIHLYIKQHNETGLKYFGKTTKNNPYKYNGSGKYWKKHLKKHGKNISTVNVWSFAEIEECEKFALAFSEDNNIVESNVWANLRPENGRDGASVGSLGMKGKDNPSYGKVNPFRGKKHTQETIALYKKNTSGAGNGNAKALTTPIGKFSTIKEASAKLKINPDTISRRCHLNENGYKWGW